MIAELSTTSSRGDLALLFLRGLNPFYSAKDGDLIKAVVENIHKGGVLVQYEKGTPIAFCIIVWPESALNIPQILHFYSEGSRVSTRTLVGYVLDKVKQKGYNKLQAVNGSGASDDIWTRAFRYEGWKIKPVKTVFEFEVE